MVETATGKIMYGVAEVIIPAPPEVILYNLQCLEQRKTWETGYSEDDLLDGVRNQSYDMSDLHNRQKVSFFDDLTHEIFISKSMVKTLYFWIIFVACGWVPTRHQIWASCKSIISYLWFQVNLIGFVKSISKL